MQHGFMGTKFSTKLKWKTQCHNCFVLTLGMTNCGPKCHSSDQISCDIHSNVSSVGKYDIASLEHTCGCAKMLSDFESWSDFCNSSYLKVAV